jgi:DNA repair protein RecN (Recombination protein N)
VLSDVRVRDLGVIEDVELRLGPGMTALTGETGAGKTLLVEALKLVLGGRATSGLVRAGAPEALVEARFVSPDREIVLARALPATGRARAWIDGRMATAAELAATSRALVDIHGQHEHQSLVTAAAQRQALDAFGGIDDGAVTEGRRQVGELRARLEELGGDESRRARDLDMLEHQMAEIAAGRIDDLGEETALGEEEERLAALASNREAIARTSERLAEGSETSVLDSLGAAIAGLGGTDAFTPWRERLRSVMAEVADVASDLRNTLEAWDDDPRRLDEVIDRRRLLGDLRRKYGATLADVCRFADDAARQAAALRDADAAALRVHEELQHRLTALVAAESRIAGLRSAAAPTLAGAVSGRLQQLAMPGARVAVEVDGPAGEAVRFLLGANPGEPMQPLARAASGGELARTMLALRLVASGGPETMIFDEVDAGVGGAAALALGLALREVSADRQVLFVTHLAQVAAAAEHQIAVRKEERQGRTFTVATALSAEERVVELSRMLSGQPDSARARAHAEELLALASASGSAS